MIERYNCPEISDIWDDYHKFKTYLEVEIALIEALEGVKIPEGISKVVKEKAKIDPKRIFEIEKTTKHDVIAFCTSITENLPKDISKYFHFGCTSSDIIDTATTLQIKQSVELIIHQTEKLIKALNIQAEKTKHIICMGRSHGMNAEPMSFGCKFLSSYAEFSRRLEDLKQFHQKQMTGQLSGAVGNYTVLTPEIEKAAIEKLGLKVEPISTQVIPRDRIISLVNITASIASAIERLATEIRHLHHSDINEVYEGFAEGQKGSSTMPHKKNPVSGENLTGLSRMIRSHLIIAHENNTLWHERDISHSSAERMMLPDNLGLTFYCLRRLTSTVENLVINDETIQKKVLNNYHYLSSYVLHRLIAENRATREELYKLVQSASFESNSPLQFKEMLEKSDLTEESDLSFIASLDEKTIRGIYLKHVESIFERVKAQYKSQLNS
ncbi:MAG: adenylosuccinate lyase [Halobacteriovoraceae bacterium]|nr:adenylosuccinate lyase [Halobacteriovoraceae bacterium]|tara:strand:- start:7057 stop:8376 length:1320 start_codon:yes stop_codon:yes gene_type:complete